MMDATVRRLPPVSRLRLALVVVQFLLLVLLVHSLKGLFLGPYAELDVSLPALGDYQLDARATSVRRSRQNRVDAMVARLYAKPPPPTTVRKPAPSLQPMASSSKGPLSDWTITGIAQMNDVSVAFVERETSERSNVRKKYRKRRKKRRGRRKSRVRRDRGKHMNSMVEGQSFLHYDVKIEAITVDSVVYRDTTSNRRYTLVYEPSDRDPAEAAPGLEPADFGQIIPGSRDSDEPVTRHEGE